MKLKLEPKWILLLTLVATAGLFATLINAPPLTWDDDSNIFKNPYYQAEMWATFWRDPYFGLYVPLTSTVWQIVYTLGAGAAWPFRLLNLCLHLTNVYLAYLILKALAKRWQINSPWPPILALSFFAFHPLQVEAVGWISGGRDLLSTMFALGATLVYFRHSGWRGFALATVLFAGAILAKPNSVILPAVILSAEILLQPEHLRGSMLRMFLWAGISLYAIQMTLDAQAEHLPSVDWLLRPWIMLDTYAFYVRKLLWPFPLSANYARTPDYVLANFRTLWLSLIFAAGVGAGLLWAWFRDRRFWLGLLWFALLLPVSGIVPFGYQKISTPADHYHYLPMLIVAAVVMLLIDHLVQWRRQTLIAAAALSVVLFAASCMRVDVWRSEENFFSDMARFAPNSYSSAIGMSIVNCVGRQDYDEGVRWTEVALAARPNDIHALANQAYCFLHAKNYFRVTELEFYLDRMDLDEMEAKQPTAYSSLLASIGTAEIEVHEYEVGYQYLCEAYRVKPSEPTNKHNLDVATGILVRQGLQPSCDTSFEPAPGGSMMDQDDPGDPDDGGGDPGDGGFPGGGGGGGGHDDDDGEYQDAAHTAQATLHAQNFLNLSRSPEVAPIAGRSHI